MYYAGIGLLVLLISLAFVAVLAGILYLYWNIGTRNKKA